jgi:hypothetical protein
MCYQKVLAVLQFETYEYHGSVPLDLPKMLKINLNLICAPSL